MSAQFTWVLNIMQKAFVLCRLFDNREKSTNGGPAASLDTSSCIEETKSKSSLAPVFPALDVQAETHQTSNQSCFAKIPDEMLSDATAPVQCENASVAEKQEAEMTSFEVIGPSFRIRYLCLSFLFFSFFFFLFFFFFVFFFCELRNMVY